MNVLAPTGIATSMETLDTGLFIDMLAEHDIKGVSYDLDDTLTGHNDDAVTDAALVTIDALFTAGIREQGIISNANDLERHRRVRRIASDVGDATGRHFFAVTTYETRFAKPRGGQFFSAAARQQLGVRSLCHVGDQLFKDVLGANLAHCGASVWVTEPMGDHPNFVTQRIQRPLEKRLLGRFSGAVLLDKV